MAVFSITMTEFPGETIKWKNEEFSACFSKETAQYGNNYIPIYEIQSSGVCLKVIHDRKKFVADTLNLKTDKLDPR